MSLLPKRHSDRDDDTDQAKTDSRTPLRAAPAQGNPNQPVGTGEQVGAGTNSNVTSAFPGGSVAPGADTSPPREASPNANVNPAPASGIQSRPGVDYTGGVDLTRATIAAQTIASPSGASGAWRLDQNQLKNMKDVPQPGSNFNWNQTYTTRDMAITAFINAVRSGQGTAVAIDSSTNEPDASAGKVANPDDPSQAKNPAA